MKELSLEELTKTRYTTEFTYGGNCCVDGIEDIAIPDMNAPTYVGPAIDKLKLFEDLYDQGLLAILDDTGKYQRLCDAFGVKRVYTSNIKLPGEAITQDLNAIMNAYREE